MNPGTDILPVNLRVSLPLEPAPYNITMQTQADFNAMVNYLRHNDGKKAVIIEEPIEGSWEPAKISTDLSKCEKLFCGTHCRTCMTVEAAISKFTKSM